MHSSSDNIIEFELTSEYIELIKLLKLLGLVESGSDAKFVVESGEVICNNSTEFRKRKKLRKGDEIIFGNDIIKIS